MEPEAKNLFASLAKAHWFQELERDELVKASAEAFGDLNVIHPFREGNGRAQRVLFEHLIMNVGYDIAGGQSRTRNGRKRISMPYIANTARLSMYSNAALENLSRLRTEPLVDSIINSPLESAPRKTANHPLKHFITPRSPAAATPRKPPGYEPVKTVLLCDNAPLLPKTHQHYMLRF
ncbi:Fic family protein [Pseudomonas alliivorans]|nr:Fic family protein [Pseudomonas alliivorans]